MKIFFYIILLSMLMLSACTHERAVVEAIPLEITLQEDIEGMPGEMFWKGQFQVADGKAIPASVSVTSKGNGILKFPGGSVKVYDSHDDGEVIDGFMLDIDLIDLNRDGLRDIVISGVTLVVGDGEDIHKRHRQVLKIYIYDKNQEEYYSIVDK